MSAASQLPDPSRARAAELCAAAGITDLTDTGYYSQDGAPWELLDRGDEACESHSWFSVVWPWGMARMSGEDEAHVPIPEDYDNSARLKRVLGKWNEQSGPPQTIEELREMSDYAFYKMVQQLCGTTAGRLVSLRRGVHMVQ